jgi:hypothetical protein
LGLAISDGQRKIGAESAPAAAIVGLSCTLRILSSPARVAACFRAD